MVAPLTQTIFLYASAIDMLVVRKCSHELWGCDISIVILLQLHEVGVTRAGVIDVAIEKL